MRWILILMLLNFTKLYSQNWEIVAEVNTGISTIIEDEVNDRLLVSGSFTYLNNVPFSTIAFYDGNNFDSLQCGIGSLCGNVLPLGGISGAWRVIYYENKLITTGSFGIASNIETAGLAYYENNTWNSFGTGLLLNNGNWGMGRYLSKDSNYVYLCGTFDSINGVPAQSVAIYNGTTWYEPENLTSVRPNLPNGFNTVQSYKDYLYLSGTFCDNENPERKICRLARFKDGEWSGVGNGIFSGLGYVNSMVVYKDKLIVGGTMSTSQGDPGNGLAAWDGNTWDNMGGGVYYSSVVQVNDMAVHGDFLYVLGLFEAAGGKEAQGLARWDGTNWCRLDSFEIYINNAIAIGFFNDTLFASGYLFSNEGVSRRLIKWLPPFQISNCGNTTSINEPKQNNVFTIYPNPTNNLVNVQFNALFSGSILICDISGRLLGSKEVKNVSNTSVTLADCAQGIYFVTVAGNNNERQTLKLIKQGDGF